MTSRRASCAARAARAGHAGSWRARNRSRWCSGPGTFINESAAQIDAGLTAQTRRRSAGQAGAEQAVHRRAGARAGRGPGAGARRTGRRLTIGSLQESLVTLALRYGLTARPSIDDPDFVNKLVFDSTKPAGTPKQRFAYLFPNRNAALVTVRLRPGLSEAAAPRRSR